MPYSARVLKPLAAEQRALVARTKFSEAVV